MAKGGARPGAGRKTGSTTKKTQEIAEKALAQGISPLEYILSIMYREPPADADPITQLSFTNLRFEAAKAAAPYMHPRLAAVELSGGVTVTHESALDALK